MTILKYETPKEEFEKYSSYNTDSPIIFLAGPTVRGNQPHLTSWRRDAEKEFEKQNYTGTLIVPEFQDKYESDQYRFDIPEWEFEGLKIADVIMFWVPRTRELIGLTTNFELGYWLARDRHKIIYGRPDDAYRMKYCDIMWVADAKENNGNCDTSIRSTLKDTINSSISLARFRIDCGY